METGIEADLDPIHLSGNTRVIRAKVIKRIRKRKRTNPTRRTKKIRSIRKTRRTSTATTLIRSANETLLCSIIGSEGTVKTATMNAITNAAHG